MNCSFDGTEYGAGFLTVKAGEDFFLQASDTSGWAAGSIWRNEWRQGHVPTAFLTFNDIDFIMQLRGSDCWRMKKYSF